MPCFDHVVWMEDRIHLYTNIGFNLYDRREIENPSEEVEESGEESKDSAVLGTRCDRCPVVNTSR